MNFSVTRLLAAAFTVAVVSLTACGGGGGGGGGTAITTPGAAVSQSYYPVISGARWSYDVTTSNPTSSYINDVVVTGTKVISGVNAWTFQESNPAGDGVAVENYYSKDAVAFRYLSDNSTANWLTAAASSFDMMRFDGTFGATPLLTKTNVDIGQDLDFDGRNDHIDLQVTGAIEGYETLVTPAGSFANTARVRYLMSGTLKLTSGPTLSFTSTILEWRAPAVGVVRQTTQATVGTTTQTDTTELRGVSVNGVVAGVLSPREFLGNLASGDSDTTSPGQPGLASDGLGYLLVSRRVSSVGWQWVGQLIAADGTLQNTFDIATAHPRGSVRVMWNGSNYLVVSENTLGTVAQRISNKGVLLDAQTSAGIELMASAGYGLAVASGGGQWLTVYGRGAAPGTLFGRFISSEGIAGDEFAIASGFALSSSPAVAFNGENFVVVWQSFVGNDLYGTRVSPQGALVDATPFAISTAADVQTWPQIACDPVNCLVTWVDRRNFSGYPLNYVPYPGDMYGAFVTRAGAVLNGSTDTGGIPIATGITKNSGFAGLAYNGSDYVVSWAREPNAGIPYGPNGIYAALVSASGSVTTPSPGIAVSGDPGGYWLNVYPTLAASSSGILAVWLKNTEASGTTKSVIGTFIWPTVSR